jgi:two-component system chemotaxis sensor kinase CheA
MSDPETTGALSFMEDLLEEFIAETRETLETLSGQLIEWEKNPADLKLVDSVFRFVHTVKGSCGFLDLPRLAKMSHAAEDLLSAARDAAVVPSTELVSAVLAVIDHIAALTNALETGIPVVDCDDELIAALFVHLIKDEEGALQILHASVPPAPISENFNEEISGPEFRGVDNQKTVRVSIKLLDQLMNGVSDLVLARNEVSRQIRKNGENLDVDHCFTRLSSIVADMRDSISLMRMQSVDRLFSNLPRVLRDANLELGKEIELEIAGAGVEIDREMVEVLRDPLTHIIRNAADHGIESREDRLAAGKSPTGKIRVSARQSGNQILIEISDDGRGIDVEMLRQRVLESGLLSEQEWSEISENSRLAMIFQPGLSTAKQVTTISGRGVGLDVVMSNIQSISGSIELENAFGHGLKMTLRLPLTLTIIAGLSVKVSGQVFGVSRNSVVEILSRKNPNVEIEQVGGKNIAVIRGKRMPYARLEDILALSNENQSSDRTLLVINPAVGGKFALDVESVIDHEEMVVKPCAPLIVKTGLYAGTSLPDNGTPMLLLDASGLANAIGYPEHDELVQENEWNDSGVLQEPVTGESALLFVTMSGRTQAIRLSALDRMEDVSVDKVKFAGGRFCVAIDDELVDLFGVDSIPATGMIQLLRFSRGDERKCLAVSDVIDTFTLDSKITPSAAPELHEGVTLVSGEAIELINISQFFSSQYGLNAGTLCFVPCTSENGWERNFLGPLLTSSGYSVTLNPEHAASADIAISIDGNADLKIDESRLVQLSSDWGHGNSAIYKYDRTGLLAAIEQKMAGAA